MGNDELEPALHPGQEKILNCLTGAFDRERFGHYYVTVTDGRCHRTYGVRAKDETQARDVALTMAARRWPGRGQTLRTSKVERRGE